MYQVNKFVFLTAVLLASLCANAENKNVRTYGLGMSSCGALVKAFRQDSPDEAINVEGKSYPSNSHAYQQWLAAFVTSYNMYGSGSGSLGNVADIHGYMEWVHSYCKKNPTVEVLVAANEMVKALEKN